MFFYDIKPKMVFLLDHLSDMSSIDSQDDFYNTDLDRFLDDFSEEATTTTTTQAVKIVVN